MSLQKYTFSVFGEQGPVGWVGGFSVVLFLFSLLCFFYGATPVGSICLGMILVANVVAWMDR